MYFQMREPAPRIVQSVLIRGKKMYTVLSLAERKGTFQKSI